MGSPGDLSCRECSGASSPHASRWPWRPPFAKPPPRAAARSDFVRVPRLAARQRPAVSPARRLRCDLACPLADRSARLLFVLGALLAGGCAPEVLAMNVANPARGGNAAGAMQSYELPPYRQDHRYEATLEAWSPSSLAFRIHLVNADRCGLPSSYSFELVDDRGRRYPFQAGRRRPRDHRAGAPGRHAARRLGRWGIRCSGRRRHPFRGAADPSGHRSRLHRRRLPLGLPGLSSNYARRDPEKAIPRSVRVGASGK